MNKVKYLSQVKKIAVVKPSHREFNSALSHTRKLESSNEDSTLEENNQYLFRVNSNKDSQRLQSLQIGKQEHYGLNSNFNNCDFNKNNKKIKMLQHKILN